MDIEHKSNKFHFFLDISGSVGGSHNYWSTVNDILTQYGPDIETFYFWDNTLSVGTKKELEQLIISQRGRGGTNPQIVAEECVKRGLENIILITDGEVSQRSVDRCNQLLANHKFNKTICFIISTSSWNIGRDSSINMSVTCPFTRKCQNKVFIKNKDVPMESIVNFKKEDFDILETFDTITLENFQAEYKKIEGLVIALNMGTEGNIPLKNDLVKLKKRLINELAKKNNKEGKKQFGGIVREFLQKNDFVSAMNQMQTSTKIVLEDQTGLELEAKIAHLISLCGDLRGKYDPNEIKSNKMAIAKDAKEAEIDKDADIMDLSKNPIECPILFEEDVPQILIDECKPILLGVEKSIVDDIAVCPLRILNYPALKNKLKSKISNYVGIMGIKAKFNRDLLKNPFTQNRLLGSIPLGTHKSHVQVGNCTIAKLMTNGKLVGNMNLYYAVIWHLIEEKQIEYLKDIEKNATEHLIFRMKTARSFASMNGQAQFFNKQVSMDIAIWYCVNSGYLNLPTDRDTFRFHFYNLEPMMKIVKTLGYPNDKNLMGHYNRTKALFNFLSVYKTMKTEHDRKTLQNMLIGLYQNGVFINSKNLCKKFVDTQTCSLFVPVDGPAITEQVEKIRNLLGQKYSFTKSLTDEELYFMAKFSKSKKSISQTSLDYNIEIPALPQAEINWNCGMKDFEHPKICPKTLRPYHHEKVANQIQEEKSLSLKQHKYFQAFVFKYDKLPTVEELILFYYNRYVESGKIKTLPYNVQKWAKNLIEEYQPYFNNSNIKKIKTIFNEYREVEKRIKAEKQN